jgi:protoporphyrin/coproporphyrin ferrochelatase
LVLDLVAEARDGGEPARLLGAEPVPGYGSSVDGAFCTTGCAASARPSAGSR